MSSENLSFFNLYDFNYFRTMFYLILKQFAILKITFVSVSLSYLIIRGRISPHHKNRFVPKSIVACVNPIKYHINTKSKVRLTEIKKCCLTFSFFRILSNIVITSPINPHNHIRGSKSTVVRHARNNRSTLAHSRAFAVFVNQNSVCSV